MREVCKDRGINKKRRSQMATAFQRVFTQILIKRLGFCSRYFFSDLFFDLQRFG